MAKSEEALKTKNFYYWMGRISDILIYPIIMIALISSFSMFSAKMENRVYMFAGHSIVKILTGSMVADGFMIDQNVIIKSVDTDDLRVNDVISFYYYYNDPYDSPLHKQEITNFDNLPFEDTDEIDYSVRKTRKDAEEAKTKIYFHKIISIHMSEDGVRFFQTKGSSNDDPETNMTREDFIVGKYIDTPVWMREVFKFFSSTTGMIILVIVPLTILICMQMLSLLEQISALMLEKKILQKIVEYDCEECMSSNVAIEMRNFDKVFLYDIVQKEKQNSLHIYMWSYLKTKRASYFKNLYRISSNAEKFYDTNRYYYWQYWITQTGPKLSKKIIKMLAKADNLKYLEANGLLIKEAPKKRRDENV